MPGRVVLDEEIFPDAIDAAAVNSHSEVIVKASSNSIKIISRNAESQNG